MKNRPTFPIADETVEPDQTTLNVMLEAISRLSEGDCDRIVILQQYHETLYLHGWADVPRYAFVRKAIPKLDD